MKSTKSLEQVLDAVSYEIQDLSLEELVHVFGYALIERGVAHMPDCPEQVTIQDIPQLISDHKSKYGQDLATAVIQQGLVMVMWLSENQKR